MQQESVTQIIIEWSNTLMNCFTQLKSLNFVKGWSVMKKFIGWTLSWLFFWLGDIVSKPLNWFEWAWWLYPVYNRLMIWSYDVQDWGGDLGPWRDSNG